MAEPCCPQAAGYFCDCYTTPYTAWLLHNYYCFCSVHIPTQKLSSLKEIEDNMAVHLCPKHKARAKRDSVVQVALLAITGHFVITELRSLNKILDFDDSVHEDYVTMHNVAYRRQLLGRSCLLPLLNTEIMLRLL
jgi:hypothetical protein